LIDPFKWKPIRRNYKKLITDPKYFRLNIGIAILFCALGMTSLLFRHDKHGSEAFTMSPLLFILLVKAANWYSRKYYNRDFLLILGGDVIKTAFFNTLSSILVLGLSLALSVITVFFIESRD
jgi:hypothetical protein